LTVPLVQAALATTQRFRVSYWDAMIIEAARAIGCHEVLSEDLNDSQSFDGVVVRNPFHTRAPRQRS
jgi:predicted nucleic acid-binding protein